MPADARDNLPAGDSAESVNLAGLSASDVAILSCIENRLCTLGLSLHGNVIEVRAQQATVADRIPARGLAIAAAEAIIRGQAG
ncbi:MAG TPA: hypothetical protein DCP11_15830 [Microbacteriaceae bacterium]|jgi:hypothetical protein|nr:hypothetical protein [Microbacteriaceae bacterium]